MTALIIIAAAFASVCLAVPALFWSLMQETHQRRFAGVANQSAASETSHELIPASVMPVSMSVPALSVSF